MIKAGICGFGGLGHVHANSLSTMENVKIEAVCDINPDQLSAKEVKFNIDAGDRVFDVCTCRTYLDYEEMLDKENLDLVVIATPSDLHSSYTIMALDAGCNVFCEKPMALSVEDSEKMVEARDRNNKQLMIGQCIRFWPEYEYLVECIRDERFGKLKSLIMDRNGGYHDEGSWFNDGNRSGGAAIDLHVHDIDFAQYFLGKPDKIYADGKIGITGKIDDISSIWSYKDYTVNFHGSWMYKGGFFMSFRAFFEEASIEYRLGVKPSELSVWKPYAVPVEIEEIPKESGYDREMRYFVDCIENGRQNTKCTAESSMENIRLAFIELDSVESGEIIKL